MCKLPADTGTRSRGRESAVRILDLENPRRRGGCLLRRSLIRRWFKSNGLSWKQDRKVLRQKKEEIPLAIRELIEQWKFASKDKIFAAPLKVEMWLTLLLPHHGTPRSWSHEGRD